MVRSKRSMKQLVAELGSIHQQLVEIEQLVVDKQPQEQFPASLFLNLPAAVYVVQDGVFKFVSPQLRQITGYSEYELIGTSLLSLILREDRLKIGEHAIELLKKRRSFVHEYRIVTKNAKIKWVMESASLMPYNGGKAVIANLIDVTEHKQAEDSIKTSEEKYHDLCENANDMIQCVTPGGLIIYANREWRETMGYSEDEIATLSLFEIVPPDYKEHWLKLLQQAVSGEKLNDVESVLINKSGNRIPVEGTINCRFMDGKPVYTRGIFRDVTKRRQEQAEAETLLKEVKEINHKLEQSNRELEEFAHIASHDLQEPLRKISSFGALLQASLIDQLDDDQRENLGFMVDGATRMQSMIDDLLAYSRITTRAKPFQHVDPNKVMEDLQNFELSAALDETKGTILIPNPLLTVYGDPSQVHQLFQNLIANGLRFHRDGIPPAMTIGSYPIQNNMVRFDVQDNGIGIDPEYHERIFVMFKRLHPPTLYEGTGIGLAICKKIVQRHGGEIGVKSTPGEWTTFWFTLPRFGQSGVLSSGGKGNSA